MNDDAYPDWPAGVYADPDTQNRWLRLETEYDGSEQPSWLISHGFVPYSETFTVPDGLLLDDALKQVVSRYFKKILSVLPDKQAGELPDGWETALRPVEQGGKRTADPGEMYWLDIWPPLDGIAPLETPRLASWNLSRDASYALPAMIIMTSAEVYSDVNEYASFEYGVRVPVEVEGNGNTFTATIRSMTAEFPRDGVVSWTELDQAGFDRVTILETLIDYFSSKATRSEIGKAAGIDPDSISPEDIQIVRTRTGEPISPETFRNQVVFRMKSKALGTEDRFPKALSYQIESDFRLLGGAGIVFRLESTEATPLITDAAGKGEAEVFLQTPPGWRGDDDPQENYDWTNRRPARPDSELMRYRDVWKFGGQTKELKGTGFDIRLCPDYVAADKGKAGKIKWVDLPGGDVPHPRRNEFSAISAYLNSSLFFSMMEDFGLGPDNFVVWAEKNVQVFYRYGIVPGPGKDGKMINAQVAYDNAVVSEAEVATKPEINVHLALGQLNRWSRPDLGDGTYGRAEPLGIATSGRWMMHEFGHYLLAARLGKLEFDFAHSPGDALAAVMFDPFSRTGDMRQDMPSSFRGLTFPFVFTTRRHDRSPLTGWAWYGQLNRSIIEDPSPGFNTFKGYLSEQILSSSVFRLYLSLGGETLCGDAPDRYTRYRASCITLFLLVRAIASFAQSPTRAEMLELAMEDIGLLMAVPFQVPDSPFSQAPVPTDLWNGGVTHKVVRWAFEAQGMFPLDEESVTNGPGTAPPVDIYIKDQRPDSVIKAGGTTYYGPGSYAPVSLDWTGERLWTCADSLLPEIGNRGMLATSGPMTWRVWLGCLSADTSQEHWDLDPVIDWKFEVQGELNATLEPNTTLAVPENAQLESAAAEMLATHANAAILVLWEVSVAFDPANTSPTANLPVQIGAFDPSTEEGQPPRVPRALTDLVACDNNLGLMVLGDLQTS